MIVKTNSLIMLRSNINNLTIVLATIQDSLEAMYVDTLTTNKRSILIEKKNIK